MSTRISRATMLKGMLALAVSSFAGKTLFGMASAKAKVPCRMLGPSMSFGHMIRDGRIKLSSQVRHTAKVVIVGGGISGLSAAWWMKKHGFDDFLLVELEDQVGGNSRSGNNQISAYPWGAHYVPIPNKESEYVRLLFEELGIIQGYDLSGRAVYNELYLCHEPQERLLKDGSFQDGMIPKRGLQPQDKADIERFLSAVHKLRDAVGSDGKPAFAIPVDLSSSDGQYRKLDDVSFGQWLRENNFHSIPLHWYLNYCCRDDYGATVDNVSAWAGIHYFAGRRGVGSNAEMNAVVTWPEGNGFLVRQLREKVKEHIQPGTAVARVEQAGGAALLSCVVPSTKDSFAVKADHVIFAAPRFMAKHIVDGAFVPADISYAPWLVANVSVRSVPHSKGIPLAWDNVNYRSNSLGYVVATHQDITTRESSTVLTYYHPLSHIEPTLARKELLENSAESLSSGIIADLEKMHPGIESEIKSIDLWTWGHGMVRPSVGFMWGNSRPAMKQACGNIVFAHSDMSGLSNFEEAQYHGVQAAQAILRKVSVT